MLSAEIRKINHDYNAKIASLQKEKEEAEGKEYERIVKEEEKKGTCAYHSHQKTKR